jgi:hypothetical protein
MFPNVSLGEAPGLRYKKLRYLLLKVKRLAVTNVDFIVVRSVK